MRPITNRGKQHPALLKSLCRFSKQALAEYAMMSRTFFCSEDQMIQAVKAFDDYINATEYDAVAKKVHSLYVKLPERLLDGTRRATPRDRRHYLLPLGRLVRKKNTLAKKLNLKATKGRKSS